jgi:NTE family protein
MGIMEGERFSNLRIVPVLSGGGTRLPAHVGVLAALGELGVPFDHLVGVSGGSIISALWAVGKGVRDMGALFRDVDFRRFRGYSLYRLLTQGGLSGGREFQLWLDGHLKGVRFGDLDYNLHVVATDVMSGMPVIFDREHTPRVRVAAAVRASMGIPLLFTFRRWRDKVLVDGSILAEDALRRDWAGDGTPTCCFRLRASGLKLGRDINPWFPLPDYLALLLRAFMTTLSREYVSETYWNTTILIDSGVIPPTEFALTRRQKMDLYERGYTTTKDVLPRKLARIAKHQARGSEPGPNAAATA